jgi:hypothetical protein
MYGSDRFVLETGIERGLAANAGSAAHGGAASRLGVPRTTLIYKIRKQGLSCAALEGAGNRPAEKQGDL